ncbi:MAG: hypothetical protein AB7M93_26135 [Candidatus Obscuribacterales bacterium]
MQADSGETINLGDLRDTMLSYEIEKTCRSSSLLISATSDLSAGGSGTLVTYRHLCGILTATHVVATHTGACEIYSAIGTGGATYYSPLERIEVMKLMYGETCDGIEALKNGEGGWPEGALDICFIQLSPDEFNRVLRISGKKAINLLEQKTKYIEKREKYISFDNNHNFLWAIYGYPRAKTIKTSCGILESEYDGVYLTGGKFTTQPLRLVSRPFDGDADVGHHEFGSTDDPLPSRFNGISGGGVWQISLCGGRSHIKIGEIFFSGVCVATRGRCLLTRGPSALYDIFLPGLEEIS